MQKLFGLMPDGAKPGRSITHNRMVLAARYLHGKGIEIGALGRPLPLPHGAHARHVDRLTHDQIIQHYPQLGGKRHIRAPDIIDNGETLEKIADESQDFVVANHVIEHFENPILFLHNVYRVLKVDGILFLAVPDKEKTFDRNRPITSFDHLFEDFKKGPHLSKEKHYREFAELADDQAFREKANQISPAKFAQELLENDYSIHFHVWDRFAILDLLYKLRKHLAILLYPEAIIATGDEIIVILRKSNT